LKSLVANEHFKVHFIGLIRLVRPKQWIKNAFVLAPLVFSGQFFVQSQLKNAFIAMLLFCLASSVTYILNDLQDIESDRCHPKKSKSRPLASGVVSKTSAVLLLLFLSAALALGWFVMPQVFMVIISYLILNLAYTFVLKHKPVLDIFTISLGFVLRVYAGGVALDVPVSSWMFITTLCLALFLASVKRRQELINIGSDSRKTLEGYSLPLMDFYSQVSSIATLIFYSMYVMSVRAELALTIPIVIFGIYRYWFLVDRTGVGESPTDVLFEDQQMAITVLLWVIVSCWLIWN